MTRLAVSLLLLVCVGFTPRLHAQFGDADEEGAPGMREEPGEGQAEEYAEDYGHERILLDKESLYHHIRVVESVGVRSLQFRRKGVDYDESQMVMDRPLGLPMDHYRSMYAGFLFVPQPKRMLTIGLGAGVLPRVISHCYPDAYHEVVELDPEVVKAARNLFDFKESPRLRVVVCDGRVHIRRLVARKETFDIVFLDAFRGGYVPYHLATREFMAQCKALLSPGGVVVSNLRSGFEIYPYQRRTIERVFTEQYVFSGGNTIVVATAQPFSYAPDELIRRAGEVRWPVEPDIDLPTVARRYSDIEDYEKTGPILTDDHAPTEILRSQPLK